MFVAVLALASASGHLLGYEPDDTTSNARGTSTQEFRANSGTASMRRGSYSVVNDNPITMTVRPTSALPP